MIGWIFDLDGTLTVPVHDFDAIRRELGLPSGQPILEGIAALPPDEAADRRRRLHRLELELADRAAPRAGAVAFVRRCQARGDPMGILTRNDRNLANRTLERIGLDGCFPIVIGRDDASPKPAPDGIVRMLEAWRLEPRRAVMVGDGLFDLQAGRAAGVRTVAVGASPWAHLADVQVERLDDIDEAALL